jgi:hypothetical protein
LEFDATCQPCVNNFTFTKGSNIALEINILVWVVVDIPSIGDELQTPTKQTISVSCG